MQRSISPCSQQTKHLEELFCCKPIFDFPSQKRQANFAWATEKSCTCQPLQNTSCQIFRASRSRRPPDTRRQVWVLGYEWCLQFASEVAHLSCLEGHRHEWRLRSRRRGCFQHRYRLRYKNGVVVLFHLLRSRQQRLWPSSQGRLSASK